MCNLKHKLDAYPSSLQLFYILEAICPSTANDGQVMASYDSFCYWESLYTGGYYDAASGVAYCNETYAGGIPIIIDTVEKMNFITDTFCDSGCRSVIRNVIKYLIV